MSVIAVVLTLVLALVGTELWGWLGNLSRAIIWLAASLLDPRRRAIRRREWLGELYEFRERRLAGVVWALCLLPVAAWERTTETRQMRLGRRHHMRVAGRKDASKWATSGALLAGTGAIVVVVVNLLTARAPAGWPNAAFGYIASLSAVGAIFGFLSCRFVAVIWRSRLPPSER
jgi:hypothetical protein